MKKKNEKNVQHYSHKKYQDYKNDIFSVSLTISFKNLQEH